MVKKENEKLLPIAKGCAEKEGRLIGGTVVLFDYLNIERARGRNRFVGPNGDYTANQPLE